MAPIWSLSESIDNLYTTTWQNMQDTVRDQAYNATPFWFWLKDKGHIKYVSGGRFISEPLRYAKNDSITWLGKGGTVPMNDIEFLTAAKFDWRYVAVNIVRFGVDDQQNRGKNQILSLMNSKLENARDSLVDALETVLFQAAGSATTGFDGLQLLVKDDPTTTTDIGAIDQGANTWWRNQTRNLTGLSFAANGVAAMRTMLNNCMNNLRMDSPDIIVSGQTPYEYYEDTVLEYYRVTNNKLADAGFINQTFKGIPMVWAPSCAATRMYFLNTNFLYLVVDPAMEMDMTEWKAIPDQVNDRAAQIVLAGQLTTCRRRCQGVIYNIDTA